MSYNNLRVKIQDYITSQWALTQTIPLYFETAIKEPSTSFVLCRIDFGKSQQASIGASNNIHRLIGAAIVYALICPSSETNANYDSYIETLFQIRKANNIDGVLLRDFDVNAKSFNGDSSTTIITQTFQADRI